MSKRTSKPHWEMNTQELRAATAEFDRPSPAGRFRRPNAAEREAWERAKRKRGRPKVGEGAEVVSVSIERGLLGRADKLAKKLKVSRAKLVADGLKRVLAEQGIRPTHSSPSSSRARPSGGKGRKKAA